MSWIFKPALKAFDQYSEMWDEINGRQGSPIPLDSRFVAPLVRHFASAQTLLGISRDRSFPGMALVEKTRNGTWQTFQPSQAPLGLIVLGNRNQIGDQMRVLMRSLPGFAIGFAVTQQDPELGLFENLAGCPGMEKIDWIRTARVTLTGPAEQFWKRRPSKSLLKKLRSQRGRLADVGAHLKFVAERDPGSVAYGVAEHGRLESAGWKGREGTAIHAENTQGRFYREVMENFCRCGEGVVYRLLLDGRTVATDMCIERDGIMIGLKKAYDEDIEGLSLGSLLTQDMYAAILAEQRIKLVEFYGPVSDWTVKWTDELRTMYHVNFFRHPWLATARRFWKTRMMRPASPAVSGHSPS